VLEDQLKRAVRALEVNESDPFSLENQFSGRQRNGGCPLFDWRVAMADWEERMLML
jgi:hypothetical protein